MASLKHTSWKWTCPLSVAAIVFVRNDRYGTKRNGHLSPRPGYPAHRK
jgi:hypothetical protein